MSSPVPPAAPHTPLAVRGGAGGIDARFDDLGRLADAVRRCAVQLVEVGLEVDLTALLLADPVTAALDPLGAASAAGRIAAAAHGPHGLTTIAAAGLALAAAVDAAACAYAAVDAAQDCALAQLLGGLLAVPEAVAAGATTWLRTGDPALAGQAALARAPSTVDAVLVGIGAGMPAQVAHLLAGWFQDGRPVLTRRAGPVAIDRSGAPRDVAGLVRGLDERNHDVPGAIDVKILTTTDPDGTVHRRAVVDIPGTKEWSPAPVNPDVTGPGSNLLALSGAESTYADGVLLALAAAGVDASTEVLFVGHSLGGMVALAAAGRAQDLGYRVGGVLTAGAPLGDVPAPAGVPVLAIENADDIVPHLDAAPNPDGPDVTTVVVDHPYGTVADNHGLDTAYLPGAADVDASTDPSVVQARARLAPFLTADTVETHVYVVTRAP